MALPTIDFAHEYLPRGQQGPEEHGGGLRTRQDGLRLDPPLDSSCKRSMALVVRIGSVAQRV